jgi:hypothetical protein
MKGLWVCVAIGEVCTTVVLALAGWHLKCRAVQGKRKYNQPPPKPVKPGKGKRSKYVVR